MSVFLFTFLLHLRELYKSCIRRKRMKELNDISPDSCEFEFIDPSIKYNLEKY